MNPNDAIDLRNGERFLVIEPIPGSFGAAEVAVVNIAIAGVQISHAAPLRIGTRARLWFRHKELIVDTRGRVIWSRITRSANSSGKLLYMSGLRIDSDPKFGSAMAALLESGNLARDEHSLEKKKKRMDERARQRWPRI